MAARSLRTLSGKRMSLTVRYTYRAPSATQGAEPATVRWYDGVMIRRYDGTTVESRYVYK